MDCSLPGSYVHVILQATILEWVVMPSSKGSSLSWGQTRVSYIFWIGRRVLYHLVQFTCSGVFNSLQPHGLQHARLPFSSPTPGAWSNSCPSSRWCHPTISSSVVPFSSCLQSFPASGSFPVSWLFTSGGQRVTWFSSIPLGVLEMGGLGWIFGSAAIFSSRLWRTMSCT